VEGLPDGYAVRPLQAGDARRLLEAVVSNREYLAPWSPRRPEEHYTLSGQEQELERHLGEIASGRMASLLLLHGDRVAGRLNLSDIVRGAFQSGNVGYWVAEQDQGRGLATSMVATALDLARTLALHQVQAGTLLHNERSQAVLRHNGFVEVGRAPRYLFIDGGWRDHVLFQRILDDAPPSRMH
jgi:ribosomal-protein-alanine N-acetyltransferase